MLIPSERHTVEDLQHWRRLAVADKLNYRLRGVDRKAAKSIEMIRTFARQQCYTSVSWGKDSTVLAHLSFLACPHVPLAWVTVGDLDIGCRQVRDVFLESFPVEYFEVEVPAGERTETGTKGKRLGFRKITNKYGPRRVMGIRGDESALRKIQARTNRGFTRRTCWPLSWWTADDVFAYLAKHNLPVHQNYAMSLGGRMDRNQLRVAPLLGLRGDQFGRTMWERAYYPEFFNDRQS